MTNEQWKELNEDTLVEMISMLNGIYNTLQNEDGAQVYQYMKPLKHLIFEAAMDATKFKNIRRDQGDDIIKQALGS